METPEDTTPTAGPLEAFRLLLLSCGFDATDFEYREHESGFGDLLGGSSRIVAVKRSSTGEERLYDAETEVDWMRAFIDDLSSGLFGKALGLAG